MRASLFFACAVLSACASPTPAERLDADATRAGLSRSVVSGVEFLHVVYARIAADTRELTVFIEGDGLPMVGDRIVKDPTTREPLALPLMLHSSGSALLVARPCYHALDDSRCTWRDWTLGRYSDAVVRSMATVIQTESRALNAQRIKLIGYSGGGALAVLIAERLGSVASVITIAANLDTDAWALHHGYTALSESLNPARSERPHPWREIHLQGVRDENVPIATTQAYFARYPNAERVTFERYDHVCCWVKDWATIAAAIDETEK